jgi:hypothetical protein
MAEGQDTQSGIQLSRIGWVGPLTVLASVIAVLAVRVVAVALLAPDPKFTPLGWAFPIIDTAILTSFSVLVFGGIASAARNPIRTFSTVARVVLVLSFLPAVATANATAWGGSWANSLGLIVMHVAGWAVCVSMLTRLMLRKNW